MVAVVAATVRVTVTADSLTGPVGVGDILADPAAEPPPEVVAALPLDEEAPEDPGTTVSIVEPTESVVVMVSELSDTTIGTIAVVVAPDESVVMIVSEPLVTTEVDTEEETPAPPVEEAPEPPAVVDAPATDSVGLLDVTGDALAPADLLVAPLDAAPWAAITLDVVAVWLRVTAPETVVPVTQVSVGVARATLEIVGVSQDMAGTPLSCSTTVGIVSR